MTVFTDATICVICNKPFTGSKSRMAQANGWAHFNCAIDGPDPHDAEIARLTARVGELEAAINTPLTDDWFAGVQLEAAHQQQRWASAHDAGKSPFDWFWLIGYLAQKAAASAVTGDTEKAKHHTISTAAALLNWHRRLAGEIGNMRPGIVPPEARAALGETPDGR